MTGRGSWCSSMQMGRQSNGGECFELEPTMGCPLDPQLFPGDDHIHLSPSFPREEGP